MRKTNKPLPTVAAPSIDPARPRELQRCGTCRFMVPHENGKDGFCHHGPPSVFPTHDGRCTSYYPPVGMDKIGCGAHEEA